MRLAHRVRRSLLWCTATGVLEFSEQCWTGFLCEKRVVYRRDLLVFRFLQKHDAHEDSGRRMSLLTSLLIYPLLGSSGIHCSNRMI